MPRSSRVRPRSSSRPVVGGAAVAAALAAGVAFSPAEAHAQDTGLFSNTTVSATGKGISGGALLGAEVMLLGTAIFGIDSGWVYLATGTLGAVGGGIGGYYVETGATDARIPMFMLAGGMALVIPTIVAVLDATAYEPPEDETPPEARGASALRRSPVPRAVARRAAQAPRHGSLLDVREGRMALGVPSVELRPLYAPRELAQFGVAQRTELRLPVLRGAF